jgi:replicative DNA helicase
MMDNLPPHSTEAEQGVLACILQDPIASLDLCSTELPPDGTAFYELRHQTLYRSLVEMHNRHQLITLAMVDSYLRAQGSTDDAGGICYVSELEDKSPSPANLPSYLEVLTDKWSRRRLITTCHNITENARHNPEEITGVIDRAQAEILAIGTEGNRRDDTVTGQQLMRETMSTLEELKDGKTCAIATGFPEFDRLLTGGFKPGQLIVIAGRPSTGKTAFGMQIAGTAATDRCVGVFSLEMSSAELGQRELAREAQDDLRAFQPDRVLDLRTQKSVAIAAHRIKDRKLLIDACPAQTVQRIRATARRWKHKHKVELILVDYLQLIEGNGRCRDRREVVDEISRGLKILAKELDLPVVALAQLNREIDKEAKRKPRLSDLRESGSIEQDADVVLMLYRRPGEDGELDPSSIGCRIAKQRNGQTLTDVLFHFHGPTFRFTEQPRTIAFDP